VNVLFSGEAFDQSRYRVIRDYSSKPAILKEWVKVVIQPIVIAWIWI